jgi:ligand-binding SRPBCC domain-containing protein
MKVHVLHHTQVLPYPLHDLFPFFEKPENLALITPPGLGFRILTPSPIVMKVGTLIDYTIRVSGVRLRWTTLITTYNPPYEFVDEQLRGPYAFWFHRHLFRSVPGGTEMTDSVHYALSLGPLGALAHLLFVKRQVRGIFAYRTKVLAGVLATAFAGASAPPTAGR